MNYRSLDFQLSKEDIKYLYDTYKTEEFRRCNYYTGYHRHPNSTSRDRSHGNFHDERLYKIYTPFISKSLKDEGLTAPKMILSYRHIWAQIYTKHFAAVMTCIIIMQIKVISCLGYTLLTFLTIRIVYFSR